MPPELTPTTRSFLTAISTSPPESTLSCRPLSARNASVEATTIAADDCMGRARGREQSASEGWRQNEDAHGEAGAVRYRAGVEEVGVGAGVVADVVLEHAAQAGLWTAHK